MDVTSAQPAPQARDLGREARDALRRDAAARRVAAAWRSLSGRRHTIAACSGGADSTALALVLRTARAPVTIAHVVHDMRDRAESIRDRDAVAGLADRLGCPFVVREVSVRTGGNPEAAGRRGRYAALVGIARETGAAFVATAHHADDQLETMLMAIARGAGLRGLAASPPSRPLGEGVTLIRPMLSVTREDAERLCGLAGESWVEDATNADPRYLRAAVRSGAAAALLATRGHAAMGAGRAAAIVRDAAGLVADRAREVFGEGLEWDRESLRRERDVVVGEGLRSAFRSCAAGERMDGLTQRLLAPAIRAVRDASGARRVFHWPTGLTLVVDRQSVSLTRPREG